MKIWLRYATQEKKPDRNTWEELISMEQMTFWEGIVPEELTCTTMILLSKGKMEYRGIGLVEVIWKMITIILKNHLRMDIYLHDDLYGFRQGIGMGMAMLKAKLEQHMTGIQGTFHKKIIGFWGFGFRRKTALTKTQQGTDKASKHNGRTV